VQEPGSFDSSMSSAVGKLLSASMMVGDLTKNREEEKKFSRRTGRKTSCSFDRFAPRAFPFDVSGTGRPLEPAAEEIHCRSVGDTTAPAVTLHIDKGQALIATLHHGLDRG
jgi:hypothetical protein